MPLPTVGEPGWGDELNEYIVQNQPGWSPYHHGLLAWTFDPGLASHDESLMGADYVFFFRFNILASSLLASVHCRVLTPGELPDNCWFGIYDPAGTLIGKTADVSADMVTVGDKEFALVAEAGESLTVQGWVYVAELAVTNRCILASIATAGGGGYVPTTANLGLSAATGWRIGYLPDLAVTLPVSIDVGDVLPIPINHQPGGMPFLALAT